MEKLVSIEQFQKDPKLQAEFGGDYNRYLSSFVQKLNQMGIFGIGSGMSIPGLDKISMFYSGHKVNNAESKEDKKFEEITKKLEQIKDSKVKAQVEAEMYMGNMSDAFFNMLMERYEKKQQEFDEVWEQYQIAKGEAANMKKTCERLLKEYQASNDDVGKKSNYLKHKNQFTDLSMNETLLLDKAFTISHRIT